MVLHMLFKSILVTSLAGTALTLILTLIRPVTQKIFSANWHYYMWLAVLISMLVPIKLGIPASINSPKPMVSEDTITYNYAQQATIINTDIPKVYEKTVTENLIPIKNIVEKSTDIFPLIWFLTAILLFSAKLLNYAIFITKIHKTTTVISCPEIRAFTKRKIVTRTGENIPSPLMTGIFRPVLILPKTSLTPEQLNNILSHEITHLKRNDILYKWFACLVKCIHWFNPAVYYVNRQIGIDCEIACDISVVKNMNDCEKKSYVDTIIALVCNANANLKAVSTGMTGNKKILKKRFNMIKNVKRKPKMLIFSLAATILLVTATVFASGIINSVVVSVSNDIIALSTDERNDDGYNTLIIGEDNYGRADTIMIISVEKEKITLISIPRNVQFNDGTSYKSISNIMSNGNQQVVDAVRRTLSIPVSYYAKFSMSSLEKVIDALGGIKFDVPSDMLYDDPHQDLHINLKKGNQLLNGKEALNMLRFRGYPDGEFSRIDTQHKFIQEFVSQKINKDFIKKLSEISEIFSENIETNYSLKNLEKDFKMFKKITEIKFYTLPGRNVTENGYFNYAVDFAKAEEILQIFRHVEKAKETLTWPCPSSKDIAAVFGTRVHPITGEEKSHNGIDIKAQIGDNVVSATFGEVIETGFDAELGNFIIIQSKDNIKTTYAQLSESTVKKGEKVTAGQVIGKVGSTGKSTGGHLHFEISVDGNLVNPQAYFE